MWFGLDLTFISSLFNCEINMFMMMNYHYKVNNMNNSFFYMKYVQSLFILFVERKLDMY